MKKVLVGVIVVAIIGAVLLVLHKSDDNALPVAPSTQQQSQATPTQGSASTTYKDGSYTGSAVQTERGYGPVQVKAIISGGKITDIQFLQMPSLPGHTSEVTAAAQPLLKQEALTAQSAQVDIVSGATQDTIAFQQSLASALTQAQ